jgi:hypothetical protein
MQSHLARSVQQQEQAPGQTAALLRVPEPRVPITTRVATMADLPFMDALQKKHSKQLGYFPTKQFQSYIEGGHVLIAQEVTGYSLLVTGEESVASNKEQVTSNTLGYIISKDRYLKRDELGVIYQLCVVPGSERKLVGASLIKAVFERSAYGCRLYCCWCAQDIEANRFWESLGFVPLAFRAGSSGKRRVHIFWQRRIDKDVTEYRSDGVTAYGNPDSVTPSPRQPVTPAPYWYPFQTNAGAIREDRIVFPIPPGTHWKDVRAVNVPTLGPTPQPALPAPKAARRSDAPPAHLPAPPSGKVGIIVGGRIKYVDRSGAKPAEAAEKPKPPRRRAEKAPKPKYDPKYLAAARELRDRCLEHVNDNGALPPPRGKYDVSRALHVEVKHIPLLAAG